MDEKYQRTFEAYAIYQAHAHVLANMVNGGIDWLAAAHQAEKVQQALAKLIGTVK